MIDNLRRQIDPDVKNSSLSLVFKWVLQITLNRWDTCGGATEVFIIPLRVSLAVVSTILTNLSVSQQMVEKFDWEDFNLIKFFELWDINMVTLSNIQKDAV